MDISLQQYFSILFQTKPFHQLRPYTALNRQSKPSLFQRCVRQTTTTIKSGETVIKAYPEISDKAQKYVGRWLLTCAGMCAGAVVIGGVTRYSDICLTRPLNCRATCYICLQISYVSLARPSVHCSFFMQPDLHAIPVGLYNIR